MQGFGALSKAALAPGALDEKTKELIAMALGVAARCDPCLGYHAQALVRRGCTLAELEELLGVCVSLGGGPALMYGANAVAGYEELGGGKGPVQVGKKQLELGDRGLAAPVAAHQRATKTPYSSLASSSQRYR